MARNEQRRQKALMKKRSKEKVPGPYDNTERIIRQLERTAGPGNYDYLMMIGGDEFDE